MGALPSRRNFGSVKITLDAIKRLWGDLYAEVLEQRKIEQHDADVHIPKGETAPVLDTLFRVACVVTYSDNRREVFYNSSDVSLPPDGVEITQIVLSNIIPYREQMQGNEPFHQFEILFDFTAPSLAEVSASHSEPTANMSGLHLGGLRHGWRAGIESAVKRHVKERNSLWTAFHGRFTYDLFLALIGMPFALFMCWRLSPLVEKLFGGMNPTVAGGAYIYVGFCSLWLYRIGFAYVRWAFPKVELIEQATVQKRHRNRLAWVSGIIVTAIIGSIFNVPFLGAIGSAIVGF